MRERALGKRMASLSPEKRELLERLLRDGGLSGDVPVVPRASTSTPPALSFAQQRLWLLDQLEPGSTSFNICSAFRLGGRLDRVALERSLNEIVRRHEALRTTFTLVAGKPVQVIAPVLSIPLPAREIPGGTEEQRAAALQSAIRDEAERSFDLARGPLLRTVLLPLAPDDHVLVLTVHHVVYDGWSVGVLMRELGLLYEAFSSGQDSPLPELQVQYADYAVWQRSWLQGEGLARLVSYWRQKLGDPLPAMLELPTDQPRPALPELVDALQHTVFALGRAHCFGTQACAPFSGRDICSCATDHSR